MLTLIRSKAASTFSSSLVFGLEYDLVLFNIVAIPDFNICGLRCNIGSELPRALNGDGLGLPESNDGDLLATIMATSFKGELPHFQAGIKIDIQIGSWYSDEGSSLESPAAYIVKGLCRICCLPEIILRWMQVNVSPSTRDDNCFEVVLRCLAVNGDRLGLHESNDGGLLATVMAAGFKESMFIPVVVGFLDSKGKDMPLTSVHHEGLLQSVCYKDMAAKSANLAVELLMYDLNWIGTGLDLD
ncbi:hypothetical protein QJS10_CPB04g01384 [Acorus calamus]|uniref:Uncharacterized protein n=1 Tax=Acorus calamus TaxID=4465 RepID=A0AAV9F1S1_ACOCL|nr:hypothetical protein QJS10_CPB04g01384 [Acorus calamus]